MEECTFPRCKRPATGEAGFVCDLHRAVFDADAYAESARAAADEELPPMIELARQFANFYLVDLLVGVQEQARRDAELFEQGRDILFEREEEE